MTQRKWTAGRSLGALVAGSALALGLASVSAQSFAAISAADAEAGDLVVSAQPHPAQFFDMSPGESRYWSISASLLDADRGALALRVFGAGELVQHPRYPLSIAVESCDGMLRGTDPRVHPSCDGADFTSVIAAQPLAGISSDPAEELADDVWLLPDIVAGEDRSFVVTLAVPPDGADDESLMGLRGAFGVGLFAAGDDEVIDEQEVDEGQDDDGEPEAIDGPDAPGLAATGGMLPLSLLLIGGGTVGLGAVLSRVYGTRRRS